MPPVTCNTTSQLAAVAGNFCYRLLGLNLKLTSFAVGIAIIAKITKMISISSLFV